MFQKSAAHHQNAIGTSASLIAVDTRMQFRNKYQTKYSPVAQKLIKFSWKFILHIALTTIEYAMAIQNTDL